ncbi:MAG: leucine-rich repeat domain-containing protein [Clostridia bacterium]|nr:leucine-rich repeat domain-containing protein [Clostridia bacterium]
MDDHKTITKNSIINSKKANRFDRFGKKLYKNLMTYLFVGGLALITLLVSITLIVQDNFSKDINDDFNTANIDVNIPSCLHNFDVHYQCLECGFIAWEQVEEYSIFEFSKNDGEVRIERLKDNNAKFVSIPNYVTSIADNALGDISRLEYNVKDNVCYLGNDENLYLLAIGVIDATASYFNIDLGCKMIYNNAFSNCDSLSSIAIPGSVTQIGKAAFLDCDNLTSVEIPNAVTIMGSAVFFSCNNLTSITISDSVVRIEPMSFEDCSNLRSVVIPNSVKSIGDFAFYGCSNLDSVEIYGFVTSIGESSFEGCCRLTNISIPNSVTDIGKSAFEDCISLIGVIIP